MFKDVRTWLSKIIEKMLDILFPRTRAAREIAEFSAADIVDRVEKAPELPEKNCFAVFHYKDPLAQTLVWQLKYRGDKAVAAKIGEILWQEMCDIFAEMEMFERLSKPIIVPVPLSRERLRERGFNQCELLAEEIMRRDSGRMFRYEKNIVRKIRNTAPQSVSRNKAERGKNLAGCFEVRRRGTVQGQCVIILDDVITTGNTVREMKRVLRRAGAKKIFAFAVAH